MSSLAALEKFLAKSVAEGRPGAQKFSDYLRANGRLAIMKRMAYANVPGTPPRSNWFGRLGETTQDMLHGAESDVEGAIGNFTEEADPDMVSHGMSHYWDLFPK